MARHVPTDQPALQLLEKFTNWRFPLGSNDGMDGGVNSQRCVHVHEVDTSCRYIPQLHAKPGRICKQVEEKKQACAHAHGHQSARQQASDGRWVHQQEARAKGSTGVVQLYENLVEGISTTRSQEVHQVARPEDGVGLLLLVWLLEIHEVFWPMNCSFVNPTSCRQMRSQSS